MCFRELLFTLSDAELLMLERALCSQEEPDFLSSTSPQRGNNASTTTTSTTTTAVQTDSPLLKKARPDESASCSSMERLGSDCSEEDPGRLGRTGCVEEIVCQSGGTAEAPPSSSVRCKSEDSAIGQAAEGSTLLPQLKNLNKSDSNDSGLHSDAVSTSDSQFTISSSDSTQLICLSGLSSPLQSPSMDEVLELHAEQSESGSMEFSAPLQDQQRPDEDKAGGKGSTDEREVHVSNDARVETTVSAEVESDASPPLEEGSIGGRLAAEEEEEEEEEEESFYTPSSGVSPLHQPSSDSAVLQASQPSRSPVMGALQHLTASGVPQEESSGLHPWRWVEESLQLQDGPVHSQRDEEEWCIGELAPGGAGGGDCDEDGQNKENWESHDDPLTSAVRTGADSEQASQQFYNVLQKVQAIFASSQSVPGELDDAGDSCDLSDSPLTDTTLTSLTPPDVGATSPPETRLAHLSSSSDTPDNVMHCPAAPHCDSNTSTLQTPCDNESQNQKTTCESGQMLDCGVTNSGVASSGCAAADGVGSTPSAVKADSNLSRKRCDRCTQTPHSAINNDQSSKIHHHHHHHNRQHSNPSTTGSASSAPSQNTPQDSAQKRQDGTKVRGERTDALKAARSGAASSRSSQSQTGKKRLVGKSQRPAGSRGHGAKTRKTSHKTQAQKFRALKPQLDVPEREARLKQYADNWSDCSSNSEGDASGSKKEEGRSPQGVVETSSSSSVCEGSSSTSDSESDQDR